jgi:flavin reductase (DIM6/NTAB) family NADH-FMN oxidoreductase RutF
MDFDFDRLAPMERYELLLATVVPRPIALITSLNPDGTVNTAPYSLFNVLSHDPPIVAVSVLPHPERRLKDTGANILATGEFVVNLVSEDIAVAMNLSCIDAPSGVEESKLANLQTTPSIKVKPPRVTASPVSLECRLLTSLAFGPHQTIAIGQVVSARVDDRCVLDKEKCLVDTPALKLIGGMHGAKWYTRTSDLFEMVRPTWAGWQKEGKV